MTDTAIPPGRTLGVFGGGQLGRMFAVAAARMGYRVVVFAPQPDCPAAQVADDHICAPYDDEDAVIRFAQQCDVITLEFENIPTACVALAAKHTPVRPGQNVLATAQDRLAERAFLDQHGLPVAPYRAVTSAEQLRDAIQEIGTPAVLKSACGGYDGLSQIVIKPDTDPAQAWEALHTTHAICEAWIQYTAEVSVLVARNPSGQTQTFGPIENQHTDHILDTSTYPANVPPAVQDHAKAMATTAAHAIGLEGIICVEMFLLEGGELLVNELAPRPHNSGHLTIEACATSQFEQQVRAVCNQPLGDMTANQPAAMVNLLGDLWEHGEPDWSSATDQPGVTLHLYGKTEARPGRKMGHLTCLAESVESARQTAQRLRTQAARTG